MTTVYDIETLGERFQKTRHGNSRLAAGQFFTPIALCDVMITLALSGSDFPRRARILDPGCGVGVFLDRLQSRPAVKALKHAELLGIELDPDAARLAGDRLGTEKIRHGNFLEMPPDTLGLFDLIIGNPPYIRHENLSADESGWQADIRSAFHEYRERYPKQAALLTGQHDAYVWFLLKSTLLLKPGGRLCFVISNSWFTSRFGQRLSRFIHHHFNVLTLMESACENWFADAAINPAVIVLEKKAMPAENTDHAVRVIRLDQPLSGSTSILKASARQVPQEVLFPVNSTLNIGFRMRAPEALRQLAERTRLFCPLSEVSQLRYPVKTGINRFFYPNKDTIARFGIEPEFLTPALKSMREMSGYRVSPESLSRWLFTCKDDKKDLRKAGKTGALHYIDWGETQTAPHRQKRTQPVPWPRVASVQGRRYWYQAPAIKSFDLLGSRFFDRRFVFPLATGPVAVDQTFYLISANAGVDPLLLAALLNSTLSYALVEFNGRSSLGDGVLQYGLGDMAALPILRPQLFSGPEREELKQAFDTLSRRALLPIDDELVRPDRRALDALIMSKLQTTGMVDDPDAFYETLTHALSRRVGERHTIARSRKNRQKKTGN